MTRFYMKPMEAERPPFFASFSAYAKVSGVADTQRREIETNPNPINHLTIWLRSALGRILSTLRH